MKKVILALIVLPLIFNIAYSEEAKEELEKAPNFYLLNLLYGCKLDATQDEVKEDNLNKYLITCINDELESAGYQLINVLPKEE